MLVPRDEMCCASRQQEGGAEGRRAARFSFYLKGITANPTPDCLLLPGTRAVGAQGRVAASWGCLSSALGARRLPAQLLQLEAPAALLLLSAPSCAKAPR